MQWPCTDQDSVIGALDETFPGQLATAYDSDFEVDDSAITEEIEEEKVSSWLGLLLLLLLLLLLVPLLLSLSRCPSIFATEWDILVVFPRRFQLTCLH